MSTQLILYPQNYRGRYNSTATPSFNEYVVNGVSFTGLGNAVTYSTTDNYPAESAIINSPPAILGNWYKYATNGGAWAVVLPPQVASGNMTMFFALTAAHSGIYQQLSGLAVGGMYNVVINIATPNIGVLTIETYSGTVLQYSQPFSSNVSQITTTFTANSTNDIFLLDFESTTASVIISDISIQESPETVSNIYTDLNDGQVICDLYQEEDIPLTLSIDDFKNVAEQVKSYSKNFSLPATKRNNQIFNNMFEVTRADDQIIFNPYRKTQCVLKQDGFILFEGYLRLIDVKDKEGEISYNVNLYSDVIALADTLKDKTFAELDFTELEHDYNKTEITRSWNESPDASITYLNPDTSGFRETYDTLRYPFIDWNHQYLVGGTNPNNNATAGNPELPTLETAFRPCIQLKYLINKIFAASGFTWTSNFFDSVDFGKLFMDFNWGADNTPNSFDVMGLGRYTSAAAENKATTSFAAIDISISNFPDEFGFNDSTNIFTCPAVQQNTTYTFNYTSVFRCYSASAQYTNFEARWLYTPSGATAIPIDATPVIQMETSASATVVVNAFQIITSINLVDGGYYPLGTPTATFTGAGTGAIVTVNMTGPAVSSVTVVNGGTGYDVFSTEIVFNNVNPLYTYSGAFTQILQPGDTLQLQMKASAIDSIRQNDVPVFLSIIPTTITGAVSMTGVTNSIFLQTLRGELGQWDFLKGIMTMFNLVSLVDETDPDNILIEPYSDVFINNTNSGNTGNLTLAARGIQHDWTDKIDVSQMELKPLTDLNKNTIFKFVEDDDDYVFRQYKNSTSGHLYGSKEIDASGFTILDGTKEIIAEPFAATVSKPIDSAFPMFIVPSIYSMTEDGESEGFENSPRIFYNNGIKDTGASYYIPAQNGLSSGNETLFLQFSHLSDIPTIAGTRDFVFESQQLFQPIGNAPINNLYNTYWSPYFNELYNADTRTMTLKVNLSPSDVSSFKFYDTVFIKNRTFRVNKINYKPNDLATVEFILIP